MLCLALRCRSALSCVRSDLYCCVASVMTQMADALPHTLPLAGSDAKLTLLEHYTRHSIQTAFTVSIQTATCGQGRLCDANPALTLTFADPPWRPGPLQLHEEPRLPWLLLRLQMRRWASAHSRCLALPGLSSCRAC